MSNVPAPQWQLIDSNQTPRRRKGCLRFMVELCGGCLLLLFGCSAFSSIIGLALLARYNDSTAHAAENASYTVPADEVLKLKVDAQIAQIEVRPAEPNSSEVRIEINKYVRSVSSNRANSALDDFDIRIRDEIEDQQTVSITTEDGVFAFAGLVPVVREIEITLVIPQDVALDIETNLGKVRIDSGSYNQAFFIQTNSGQIELSNIELDGTLTLRTYTGTIEVKNSIINGKIDAKARLGGVFFRKNHTPEGIVATVLNGGIEFEGNIQGDNPEVVYEFTATNGDVSLKIDDSSAFYLEASAGNFGEVENDLTLRDSTPSQNDQQIDGWYNTDKDSAVPKVIARSENGAVNIDTE
jgi:hypothetical protein